MQPTAKQDQHVQANLRAMREAMTKFSEFDLKWNRLNNQLDKWCDDMSITDIVQRDRVKSENLTLAGHYAAACWWRDKATALSSSIIAEKAALDMLGRDGGPWNIR